jgi:hypothetical protein
MHNITTSRLRMHLDALHQIKRWVEALMHRFSTRRRLHTVVELLRAEIIEVGDAARAEEALCRGDDIAPAQRLLLRSFHRVDWPQ